MMAPPALNLCLFRSDVAAITRSQWMAFVDAIRGSMVGDGYQIDLAAMTTLVGTLKDAATSITNANTALKNASVQQLGHDELDSAGSDFKDRWDYGTGKIADLTGTMTDALHATVQAYQDTETQIAQSFQPPAGTASVPPNSGGSSRVQNALAGGTGS